MRLDGSPVSKKIIADFQERLQKVQARQITPTLKVVLIGEDLSAQAYVRMIERNFSKNGFGAEVDLLPGSISEGEFLAYLEGLNKNDGIHGVLIQMPLPRQINGDRVFEVLSPEKDVDGCTSENAGRLSQNKDAFFPCTPFGIMKLLDFYEMPLAGKLVVVIGRSNIVGKPISMLMLNKDATVVCCHSKTQNMKALTRQADIVVAAVGKPEFLTADYIGPNTTVIDVGIHDIDGKLVGDVNYADVEPVAQHITPVPGGVGSTTIATLMENTLKAVERQLGL